VLDHGRERLDLGGGEVQSESRSKLPEGIGQTIRWVVIFAMLEAREPPHRLSERASQRSIRVTAVMSGFGVERPSERAEEALAVEELLYERRLGRSPFEHCRRHHRLVSELIQQGGSQSVPLMIQVRVVRHREHMGDFCRFSDEGAAVRRPGRRAREDRFYKGCKAAHPVVVKDRSLPKAQLREALANRREILDEEGVSLGGGYIH
jgi:hypothetical protein